MRSEKEMLELILGVATSSDLIRVVAMNGSRTNSSIPKDSWQDYDIVYLVEDADKFVDNREWIDVFGERLIMQTPMDSDPSGQKWFTYLMQFQDGNRIDLTIVPLSDLQEYLESDSLIEILLDKDTMTPSLDRSNDSKYWVKKPSRQTFADCINEFLWVSLYVVKGIHRRNMIYAIEHLNIMRTCYLEMCDTLYGIHTQFNSNVGKGHQQLEKFLSSEQWNRLLSTYSMSDFNQIIEALSILLIDFRRVSERVSSSLNYTIDKEEYQRLVEYIEKDLDITINDID